MAESENPHWIQSNWVKVVMLIIAIIGCFVGVYKLLIEPTTEISATYSVSAFEIPDYSKHTTKSDTIIVKQAAFIRRLNRAYLDRLSFKDRIFVPDSLNPFRNEYIYSSNSHSQIQDFTIDHHSFAALSIKNEGKKLVKQIQILHESPVYYEYKDSNGNLQAGRSETKFSIGELSPTEKREISLWLLSRYGLGEKGIVVTYDDGRVVAEQPVEATGGTAWLVKNLYLGWPLAISILMMIILIGAPALLRRQRI